MTANWEIFTIIGAAVGVIALKPIFFTKPKEEIEAFFASFKATQRLSIEVSNEIFELATQYNGWDAEFSDGVTMKIGYDLLIESQQTNLSDELFEKLKKEKLTKPLIQSMQQSLDRQFSELQQLQGRLKVIRKKLG